MCLGFKSENSEAARGLGIGDEQSPTLTTQHAQAVALGIYDEMTPKVSDNVMPTMRRGGDGGTMMTVCIGLQTDHLSQNGTIWSADVAKTLDTQQPSAVCIASGQANAEATLDGSTPTLTTLHEAPILAYSMVERCGKPGGGKGPLLQEDVSSTIRAEGMQQTIFQPYGADVRDGRLTENLSGTLQTRSESLNFTNPALVPKGSDYVIRRLTPLECERLQGFPDDWTRIPWKGKPAEECPDTLRYRCCGNSMAVPVMRWLGERIQMVDKIQ